MESAANTNQTSENPAASALLGLDFQSPRLPQDDQCTPSGPIVPVHVFGDADAEDSWLESSSEQTGRARERLDRERSKESFRPVSEYLGHSEHFWILRLYRIHGEASSRPAARRHARDLLAAWWKGMASEASQSKRTDQEHFHLHWHQCSDEQKLGGLIGLEQADYRFYQGAQSRLTARKTHESNQVHRWQLSAQPDTNIDQELQLKAQAIGQAMLTARYLIDLPANLLSPASYQRFVEKLFSEQDAVEIKVWQEQELEEMGCGLHVAVGRAAVEKSRLIRMRYRPLAPGNNSNSGQTQPWAIVGKGITFDTGGLNLKPGSAMSRMKKDMGGSALCVGLAHWAARTNFSKPLDIYLAIAENAVDERAFRPGDVLKSASGLGVEITNTDAEGRLVLADAITVASRDEDKPAAIIDLATLTGAARVALGDEIVPFSTNQLEWPSELLEAAELTGDYVWPLPLHQPYERHLQSQVTDLVNAPLSFRFAGSTTAALFLKRFVPAKMPWLHLDLYGWSDDGQVNMGSKGGCATGLETLIEWLSRRFA